MKLIVITPEANLPHEHRYIERLFDLGLTTLHLRKPFATEEETHAYIEAISEQWHNRVVLHDHFALAAEYGLKGVHLNGRNPHIPEGWRDSVSCSCHSLSELAAAKERDYCFLSPLFDSISKQGYSSGFTTEELDNAARQRIITPQVVALGGITLAHLPTVRQWGFGGVAMIGYIWSAQNKGEMEEKYKKLCCNL